MYSFKCILDMMWMLLLDMFSKSCYIVWREFLS